MRLGFSHPFHAAVLGGWVFAPDATLGTVAVGMRDFRLTLFFNPTFVAGLPADQLAGVLHHVVNHVILGHVVADLRDYSDEASWVVAADLTANEYLSGEPLPGRAFVLADYPWLPPLESTRQRYERMVAHKQRGSAPETPGDAPKMAGDCTENALGEMESGAVCPGLVDDHSRWPGGQAAQAAQAVVRQAVTDARRSVPDSAWAELPASVQEGVVALCRSDRPGDDREEVTEGDLAHVDWRAELRDYARRLAEPRPVLNWPSRRAPQLVGVVPGRRRRAGRARVLAAIDTSGSISRAQLDLIAAELAELGRRHEVVVAECDAAVQSVYLFCGKVGAVRGRGSTDFRPVLAPAFWRAIRPDVIVYFTDGNGPAPPLPPACPLLWCLVPGGRRLAEYGRVIVLTGAT
jgi:predicted metal-dependent peptidase